MHSSAQHFCGITTSVVIITLVISTFHFNNYRVETLENEISRVAVMKSSQHLDWFFIMRCGGPGQIATGLCALK